MSTRAVRLSTTSSEGPERDDLDVYAAMVDEFGAASVVDVGCGTGTFATMLAGRGVEVVGVDPSALALDALARKKPNPDQVTWVHGVAVDLPPLQADMAFMTANVAQAILGAEEWSETLMAIRRSLRPGGLHRLRITRPREAGVAGMDEREHLFGGRGRR